MYSLGLNVFCMLISKFREVYCVYLHNYIGIIFVCNLLYILSFIEITTQHLQSNANNDDAKYDNYS